MTSLVVLQNPGLAMMTPLGAAPMTPSVMALKLTAAESPEKLLNEHGPQIPMQLVCLASLPRNGVTK